MLGKLLKKISTPPPLQVGKRNLERAWRAIINNDGSKAREYNARAAEAFRRMLEEDLAKNKRTFPSRLAAAGIALLRDGDPETAAPLLARAVEQQKILLQAYVWAGLAYGQIGDREAALRFWNAFPGIQTGQAVLNKVVLDQKTALENGTTDLAHACEEIERGLIQQDRVDHREGKGFWLLERL